jgi:hypothetical protein
LVFLLHCATREMLTYLFGPCTIVGRSLTINILHKTKNK